MENNFNWINFFFNGLVDNVNNIPLSQYVIDNNRQRLYSNPMYHFHHPPRNDITSDPVVRTSTSQSQYSSSELRELQQQVIENANRLRMMTSLQYIQHSNNVNSMNDTSQQTSYNYNINVDTPQMSTGSSRMANNDGLFHDLGDMINDILLESLTTLTAIRPEDFEDVKVTISETQFNKLRNHTITDEDTINIEECSICMEPYVLNEEVKVLPCKHMFHIECVRKWLCCEKTSCPTCREDVRKLHID